MELDNNFCSILFNMERFSQLELKDIFLKMMTFFCFSYRSSMKKSIRKPAPSPPGGSPGGVILEASEERDDKQKVEKKKYSSEESSEEEDTRHLEGNVYTKAGFEVLLINPIHLNLRRSQLRAR